MAHAAHRPELEEGIYIEPISKIIFLCWGLGRIQKKFKSKIAAMQQGNTNLECDVKCGKIHDRHAHTPITRQRKMNIPQGEQKTSRNVFFFSRMDYYMCMATNSFSQGEIKESTKNTLLPIHKRQLSAHGSFIYSYTRLTKAMMGRCH